MYYVTFLITSVGMVIIMCFVCSGEVISLLVLLAIFPGRRWAECAARSTFRQVSQFEGGLAVVIF